MNKKLNKNNTETSPNRTAIIVGVLFITATVAGILSEVFGPKLDSPDYLANLSANGNQVFK